MVIDRDTERKRVVPDLSVKDLQEMVYNEYVQKGFYEKWEQVTPYEIGYLCEVGLIAEEIGEVQREIRRNGLFFRNKILHNLCDIIIRALNMATRLQATKTTTYYNIAYYLLQTHNENMKRDNLHGKKVI